MGHQLFNRLLGHLHEGDDHDDREDKDADGLETLAADGKLALQLVQAPVDELVGGPHDEGAEEVQGGIDEGGEQGERVGGEDGDTLGDEEEDVGGDVDVDGPARAAAALDALVALGLGQERLDALVGVAQGAAALVHAVVVKVLGVHRVEHVVGEGEHECVDLEPVVKLLILLLVEAAHLLVLDGLELIVAHAELLKRVAARAREQLLLDVLASLAVDGGIDDVAEAGAVRAEETRLDVVDAPIVLVRIGAVEEVVSAGGRHVARRGSGRERAVEMVAVDVGYALAPRDMESA